MMREFQAVRRNMTSMLDYAEREFKQYKKTGDVVYLQQAGEKLFNAIENYIQYVNRMRYENFYEIQRSIKEKPLKRLLYDARNLHRFFYNGELEMTPEYAEEEFIRISALMKGRVKRL